MAELSKAEKAWLDRVSSHCDGFWVSPGTGGADCVGCFGHLYGSDCAQCEGFGTGTDENGDEDTETHCAVCGGSGEAPLVVSEDDRQAVEEGSFSWRSCDSCGTTLGGNRYPAHGITQTGEGSSCVGIHHMEICVDCVAFHANGDIPLWLPEDESCEEDESEDDSWVDCPGCYSDANPHSPFCPSQSEEDV